MRHSHLICLIYARMKIWQLDILKLYRHILFISAVFNLVGNDAAFSQASDCSPDPNLQLHYGEDIKHLALKRMQDLQADEADRAVIDQNWQDSIWRGLAAIYNSGSTWRDSVFDIYCIHHESPASGTIVHSLYVFPDPEVSWFGNWDSGNITTGDQQLDAFIGRYGFYVDGEFWNGFRLTTDETYNMIPIQETMQMHDSIGYVELAFAAGDGNQILYNTDGHFQYFEFILAGGDCPAGCIFSYSWKFKVDTECQVSFLGTSDNGMGGLPPPVNCNISSGLQEAGDKSSPFNIYPNPASQFILIDLPPATTGRIDFEIFNSLGISRQQGTTYAGSAIFIGNLAPGNYFIHLSGEGLKGISKFVKY